MFARLSPFAGGFTLEVAEAVCDATIDGLASLVEKSLLTHRESGDEPRFGMLETLREYARNQLEERGEADEVADRHAEHFLNRVERSNALARNEGFDAGSDLIAELDNLRSALGWLAAAGDVERRLRFATAASWCLWTRVSLRELKVWLEAALERADGVDGGVRADALGAAALVASNLGEIELARRYARDSLALARERNDKRQIEWALRVLSFHEPDVAERRKLLSECERLLHELGYESGLGWVTYLLGLTSLEEGDFERAQPLLERAVGIFRRLGRRWDAANAELGLAFVLRAAGRPDEVVPIADRAIALALELDSRSLASEALVVLASARVEDEPAAATRLVSAAQAMGEAAGQPLDVQFAQPLATETLQTGRERLGERFESEVEAGSRLTLEGAAELARSLV